MSIRKANRQYSKSELLQKMRQLFEVNQLLQRAIAAKGLQVQVTETGITLVEAQNEAPVSRPE
jgi:CTP-dependent riboflavin kinase